MTIAPSRPPDDALLHPSGQLQATWQLHFANQFEFQKSLSQAVVDATTGTSGVSRSAAEAAERAAAAQVVAGGANTASNQALIQAGQALAAVIALQSNAWVVGDYRPHESSDLGPDWLRCDGGRHSIDTYPELFARLNGRTGPPTVDGFATPQIEPITNPPPTDGQPVLYWHIRAR